MLGCTGHLLDSALFYLGMSDLEPYKVTTYHMHVSVKNTN